jgi:Gas vesicle synthesis protein GvpL/GvpF
MIDPPEDLPDEHGIWVYAVTRDLDPAVLGRMTGVAGEAPYLVEAGGLVAVAGSVPLSSFGDEALRRNFENLEWLSAVARVHDAVVGELAAFGPVVPFRLATVYLDDDRVRLVLDRLRHDFERALAHVTGRTEWGVKAFLEPAATEPEPAAQSGGRTAGTGADYLRRRRSRLEMRERRDRVAAERIERIHAVLAGLAADARRHRPHGPQLSGEEHPMILNAAYLVDNGGTREFTRTVAELDSEQDAVRLQLTGPWPPYSFSTLEELEEHP